MHMAIDHFTLKLLLIAVDSNVLIYPCMHWDGTCMAKS